MLPMSASILLPFCEQYLFANSRFLFVSSASTAVLGAGRKHHRTPHAQIRNGHPLLQQEMSGHDETKSDIGGLKLLIVT